MEKKKGFKLLTDNYGNDIYAKTQGQVEVCKAIDENQIIFIDGPQGTGKSYLSCVKAIQALKLGKTDRVVLIRPAVEAGESLGFLPGTLEEKLDPFCTAFYDILKDFVSKEKPKVQGEHPSKYKEKRKKKEKDSPSEYEKQTVVNYTDKIQVRAVAFLRGLTFNDCYVLVDEAQNLTKSQIKLILTRIGKNCKIIITGDYKQLDISSNKTGFLDAINRLSGVETIGVVRLTSEDIVRNDIIKVILERYNDE